MKHFRLHPLSRLCVVFALTTCSFLYLDIIVQAVIFLISLGLVFTVKISLKERQKLIKNLYRLISVAVSIFIIQMLFTKNGKVLFATGWIEISSGGLETALIVSIRLVVLVLMAGWLMGMSPKDYMDAFDIIKLPESFAVMIAMTIRFLPLLLHQMEETKLKIILRGIDLKDLGIKKRLKLYRQMLIPILGRTLKEVKYQAIALDLRGFRNGLRHSRFEKKSLLLWDYLLIILLTVLCVVPAFLLGS